MVTREFVVRRGGAQPVGDRLMELCPPELRQHLVGRLHDQHVPEPERLAFGRPLGAHEVLADEFAERGVGARDVLVEQLGHAGGVERSSDDGSDAQHGALVGWEPIEPGGEQGVHGCGEHDTAEIAG